MATAAKLPGDEEIQDLSFLLKELGSFSTPQTLELHLTSGYVLGMIERILYPLKSRHDLKQALRAVHKALEPHIYKCRLVHCGKQIARVYIVVKSRGVVGQNRTRILDEPIHGKRNQSALGIAPRAGEGRGDHATTGRSHTGPAPPPRLGCTISGLRSLLRARSPGERPQMELLLLHSLTAQ